MMKKMLALLLALCMALGMTTSLAEADASGTWYLVMTGLTVATFELNGDGTCALTVDLEGTEQKMEGSWTQEGDKVTIVANGQTMPLVLDGGNLVFSAEDVAALGLDQSGAIGAGMDLSVLTALIQISREPGLLTQSEFSAYQQNGTLPEGKTKEDMDAIQAQMMTSLMTLMGSAGALMEGQDPSQEQPAPELTVLEDNFYVRAGYETQECVYFAKVQNNSDVTVILSNGTMSLLDESGIEIGRSEYMGSTGSRYLEPGEISFVSLMAEVPDASLVKNHEVHLETANVSPYETKDVALEGSGAELRVEDSYGFTSYYAAVTVTNTTDQPMTGISAAIAVRNSEGKLIDIVTPGLYGNELAAGSTIILVDSMDSRAADYCAENGVTPGEVEALVWVAVE